MSVLKPPAFEPGGFKTTMLDEIKRSGHRIVLLLCYDEDAQVVAKTADTEGMTVGWAFLCTEDKGGGLMEFHGWVWLRTFLPSEGMRAFAENVKRYSESHVNLEIAAESVDLQYSVALYDAVMLFAHAAKSVQDVGDAKALTASIRNTSFMGIGGTAVILDEQGDRVQDYEVMNYIREPEDAISSVPVGIYKVAGGRYQPYAQAVIWPGPHCTIVGCAFAVSTLVFA